MFGIEIGPEGPGGRRRRFYDASRAQATRTGDRARMQNRHVRTRLAVKLCQIVAISRCLTFQAASEGCHARVD